jgi:hypothetical protein
LVKGGEVSGTVLVASPSFQDTAAKSDVDNQQSQDAELLRRVHDEQSAALSWSSKQRSPLYFGPCDQVEGVVRSVFGNSVRSVSVSQFNGQITRVDKVDDREQPEDDNTAAIVTTTASSAPAQEDIARPSTSYSSAGVAHDSSCGGDYVLGSVYNASGQLVQAVAVVYTDDLGNRSYAAAVNGAYRFPVASPDTPHNIYLSLVDATGASVSGTVTIPYHQGGASDLGCHYVVWQGVN